MGLTISVIVPSYQRTEDLVRCLKALAAQLRPADEICGISQAADAETIAVFRAQSAEIVHLRLTLVDRPGLVHALNEGIAHSTGDIVVLTDDDAEADPDWLKRIEEWFLKDASVGAVGGRDRLQYPGYPHLSDPPPVSKVGKLTWYGVMIGNHHCPTRQPMEVDCLKGVNLAVRRVALDPEGFALDLRGKSTQLGSELDLCMRVKEKGFRIIFDPEVSVKHYASKRPSGVERTKVETYEGVTARDIVFNYGFLAGKWYSPLQVFGSFFMTLFKGSRRLPGLLAIIKWCMLGEFSVIRRFVNQFPASIEGYRAGIKKRRERKRQAATDRR